MRRAAFLAFAGLLLLAACDDMSDQPRQKTYTPHASPPAQPEGRAMYDEQPSPPPKLTMDLMLRGQEQFRIYCTPCHSELGDGNGMVVQRGFPRPPNYTDPDLMTAKTQHFYDVITHGWGVMYAFADRVKPEDRWAIAAYIRALQKSQHASLGDLTPGERSLLK